MRSPDGAYTERHLPISDARAYRLSTRQVDEVAEEPVEEADGVAAPQVRRRRARARLSRAWSGVELPPATAEELAAAHRHAEHAQELEAGLEHPVDGHEFDDHQLRDSEAVPLRGGPGGSHRD